MDGWMEGWKPWIGWREGAGEKERTEVRCRGREDTRMVGGWPSLSCGRTLISRGSSSLGRILKPHRIPIPSTPPKSRPSLALA